MNIGGIEFPDNPTEEDFHKLAKEWCDFRGIFTGAGNDIVLGNLLREVWKYGVLAGRVEVTLEILDAGAPGA